MQSQIETLEKPRMNTEVVTSLGYGAKTLKEENRCMYVFQIFILYVNFSASFKIVQVD